MLGFYTMPELMKYSGRSRYAILKAVENEQLRGEKLYFEGRVRWVFYNKSVVRWLSS